MQPVVGTHLGESSFEFDSASPPEALFEGLPFVHEPESAYYRDIIRSPWYYPVLRGIVETMKPSSILEFGTFWGYSMMAMLRGHDFIVEALTLDNEDPSYLPHADDRFLDKAFANINAICPTNTLLRCARWDTAWGIPKQYLDHRWDMIYVDGDHTFNGACRDLDLALRYVSPGGWIVVDDVAFIDDVARAVERVLMGKVGFSFEVSTKTLSEPRGMLVAKAKS